jgi:hypothetical protein
MEQKKKQIRDCIYTFVQTWWPWLLDILLVVFFVAFLCALIGCKSSKVISDRDVRDSVVYTYKTLYRDSLRVKDSTVLVYETVQRDSIVLKVDKATGEVLSKDTWHWKDTSKDRDHVSETRNKSEKSDSAGSVTVKSDKRTVVTKDSPKPLDVKKTHYWKTYWLGMLTGVLIMLLWKYRKILIKLLKKAVRLRI